jgi:hypothetical protein
LRGPAKRPRNHSRGDVIHAHAKRSRFGSTNCRRRRHRAGAGRRRAYVGTGPIRHAGRAGGECARHRQDRYQHEPLHLPIGHRQDSDWKIAECTAEGAPLAYDFTLTVSGDTLTFTDSGGARDFLRCK